jgi:hypothetical protein
MVTYTIKIPPMLAYIPYMDPMGYEWKCSSKLEMMIFGENTLKSTVQIGE